MRKYLSVIFLVGLISLLTVILTPVKAHGQTLGTAGSYGVLGNSTVTNTGSSVVQGNLGLTPGTSITGFSAIDGGPGSFTGALNVANGAALQAQTDAGIAYGTLAGLSVTSDLTGQDLGGMTLTPGVYSFSSSAQLTGTLTLNALGDSNARFVFRMGSTLTTASDSVVNIINVGDSCGPENGLYWLAGSSATIGTYSQFAGSILARESVTLNTGANIDVGRAIAIHGAVTLDNNQINASDISGGFCALGGGGSGGGITPVPEPSSYAAAGALMLGGIVWLRRRR